MISASSRASLNPLASDQETHGERWILVSGKTDLQWRHPRMNFRRIAASALCLILCSPFLAAATKRQLAKKSPPADPVCDLFPLRATSIQKLPLSQTQQQQLDDKLLDAAEDSNIDALK